MFLVTDFFTLILGFMRKGTAIERIPDNYMAQTEHVGLVMSLGGAWYVWTVAGLMDILTYFVVSISLCTGTFK